MESKKDEKKLTGVWSISWWEQVKVTPYDNITDNKLEASIRRMSQ